MFLMEKTKNVLVTIIAFLFAIICLFVGLNYSFTQKNIFAETIDIPTYLNIKSSVDDREFYDKSTIFLDEGEKLNITLGQPKNEVTYDINDEVIPFENQSDIGSYALSYLESSFSLTINHVEQNLSKFKSAESKFLKFVPYQYNDNSPYMYFDLTIDLGAYDGDENCYFPTGEYVLTFSDYVEYSGPAFSVTKYCTFSITLYIFNTTDYFTYDSATSQNVEFLNVAHSSPSSVSYRNYYFFNYNNIKSSSLSSTQNFLPQLKFDASKFIVNISKSVAGTTYSCEVSTFNTNLITLDNTTPTNFLTATYNTQTDEIIITFQDIGEYVFDFQFVYKDFNNNPVYLESEEILDIYEKKDLLTIFGYQIYHTGQINSQTEFKAFNDDRSATKPLQSADITYLIDATDENLIMPDNDENLTSNDEQILQMIKNGNIQPVSTNQPTVVLNTNSQLIPSSSCVYYFNNGIKSDTNLGTSTIFQNQSFSQNGTYLLRVVYTQPTYYNIYGQLADETLFVQYFFFTITTTTPSLTIVDSENNQLSANSYTKNETKVILQGQSVFNREVTMQVYKKLFGGTTYTACFTTPIKAQENDVIVTVNEEAHYMVQILSGKNNSKTTYFTIDKTEISGIHIIPVEKNSDSQYIKDENELHYVKFFTSENVVVEWNEKQSGAETYAFYKYIPFTQNTNPIGLENNKIHKLTTVQGIITTDSLTFDLSKEYNKSSYINNLNQVNPSQVFSNQGVYIFYVYDQAGHENNFAFCIDKTEIQIMQYNPENMTYDTVSGYNLVTRDSTVIEWGSYKLIDLNIQQSDINSIADDWIKNFFVNKMNESNPKIRAINQDLYFAVNISSTYALRTGTTLQKITNNSGSDTVNLITSSEGGQFFANEITYHYYLIDESNKIYNDTASITSNTIVENFDKDYQITTSSDASNANIYVNEATTINEFVLTTNSVALTQAGFADSYSEDRLSTPDIRTKYYFATGTTFSNKVDMLSYKIKLNINSSLYVSKITMYYYPFTTINHNQTLSSDYVKTILYDKTSLTTSNPTKLTGEGNEDYYAFNLNVGTYQSLTQYQTLAGKYVIVREYNSTDYDTYDFKIRESVFIVDREDIVSSPESYNNELISTVGNGIYINVLDNSTNAQQFKNIYSAKNNAQTYILQTNKLPVVVYVPTTKYGLQNSTSFLPDSSLNYYLATNGDNLIRCDTETKLERISFGSLITEKFTENSACYVSPDYDLTATITSSNGTSTVFTKNNLGYWQSEALIEPGKYTVTITQNDKYGEEFPNVYNTFTFSFQIMEIPPDFIFTSANDTQNAGTIDSDQNGIYYTNIDDKVKIVWTDPTDTTYFAKINYQPDEKGTTKIKYYVTTSQNVDLQPVYIKYDKIESNENTHWFYIDISTLPSDSILNVYMEYERGKVDNANAKFEQQTTVTKHLYIDRYAPTEIINILSEKTILNDQNFAQKTRKNVIIDEYGELVDSDTTFKYNVTQTSGAYANYAYAVKNSDTNEFLSLFQNNTSTKYRTNGYYRYFSKVNDITQYTSTNIDTALSLAKTSQSVSIQSLSVNTYYEIIEVDLAGNIAIYLVYVVDSIYNEISFAFESEPTDHTPNHQIYFNDLQDAQDIYAKTFLKVTNINLYNYAFLEFSLDGEIYFKTSALPDNQCYQVSTLTTATTLPKSVNIQSLLNFTAPSHHTLIINDSILGKNYTFDLYVNNKNLSYSLLSSGEGITITVPSNSLQDIKHYLSSITISSYDNNLNKYVVIYNKTENFTSNSAVEASNITLGKSYTFIIVNPNLAYTYSFVDNYGTSYIEYHTAGGFVLDNNQKIKNYLDIVNISETIDTDTISNEWYVGNSNIIFNYSSADYDAYLKIFVLSQNKDKTFGWQEVTKTLDSTYGTPISAQANYITVNSTVYCGISTSPLHSTVKQLILYAPSNNLLNKDFTGGVYRFEITQVNHYDQSPDKTITTRIVINNLTPIIDLQDKNKISLSATDAIYTEQITIIIPSLHEIDELYTNPEVSKYLFDFASYVNYESTITSLNSGVIVTKPGQYQVLVYEIVNSNNYLISSKTFIIADSPTDFYQVWIKDANTNQLVLAQTTGQEYVHGDTICYHHYIINDDPYIFLNETQAIHKEIIETITNENATTTIYKISNYEYLSSYTISPYETKIAITKIPKTDSILTNFTYTLNNNDGKAFTGTGTNIIITENEQNNNSVTIKFKSYYGIPENYITATYTWQGNTYTLNSSTTKTTNSIISFNLKNSGEYYLSFTDIAGNKQIFKDNNNIEQSYAYKLLFINGVPYLINGSSPIQNAIYNDQVEITVPNYLNSIYDSGGKPTIVVYKNNVLLENVKSANGVYTLKDEGYYTVYFNALINNNKLRKESYSFQIISQNAHITSFNYAEYSNYEISSVYKNNEDITSKIKRLYNLASNEKLTSLAVSLYDEKTGQGTYKITILTNSGLYKVENNQNIPEQFTFSFVIKSPISVPIFVSVNEGTVTKNPITIEFNALDLFNEIGECTIHYGNTSLQINQDYLDTLNGNYYRTLQINEKGTYYIQVYSSDNLLYSYRVDKKDPLNTVSIILIIGGVAIAVALTISIVLLRKKMKIK